ncbi:MAG TPA: dodecin family protein [bacterium]|jgi:flavin-binding protein dodecin|nr:dodecin domain-containing protein [Chlamydiota bacterium]HOE27671.1 dodecin family protein [bacterium]HQM52931.1 dodecin family protein [bacterium]
MAKTYKTIDVIGTSSKGFADAAKNAIEEAGKSIKAMGWFEVDKIGGRIDNGTVSEYQAKVRIGFRLLSPEELKNA